MSDDDVSSRRRRKKERALLWSLNVSVDLGCYAILRKEMNAYGPSLESSEDPDVRSGYAQIVAAAQEAFQIEAIHGQGSLLKLDHPAVIDLIGRHAPRVPAAITQAEIEAAKRYRSLMAPEA